MLKALCVYEIDQPAIQAWKRERLAQLAGELPAALEFIPIDFEHETIAEALCRSSYRSDRRAFFSWLGTLPYLSETAILRTLESIAAASVAGSEIVLDYRVATQFIDAAKVPLVQAGDWITVGGGQSAGRGDGLHPMSHHYYAHFRRRR